MAYWHWFGEGGPRAGKNENAGVREADLCDYCVRVFLWLDDIVPTRLIWYVYPTCKHVRPNQICPRERMAARAACTVIWAAPWSSHTKQAPSATSSLNVISHNL